MPKKIREAQQARMNSPEESPSSKSPSTRDTKILEKETEIAVSATRKDLIDTGPGQGPPTESEGPPGSTRAAVAALVTEATRRRSRRSPTSGTPDPIKTYEFSSSCFHRSLPLFGFSCCTIKSKYKDKYFECCSLYLICSLISFLSYVCVY
ncbi:hypothetical protein GE061_018681 [Apolygus lucorum]|uniref:Uncharacterized protein n=1 Tax=Apolygus lucorum TaxID=248454 RepID=A0A8S9XGN3_APOLU|nr:hypothetical protein GE061_018681 [Apolygus lucorum]